MQSSPPASLHGLRVEGCRAHSLATGDPTARREMAELRSRNQDANRITDDAQTDQVNAMKSALAMAIQDGEVNADMVRMRNEEASPLDAH